ncbi:MAG TPA: TonB-dependent receptor [Caulobacteraceae bacterium]|jgi:outer membrane receptor protein involved in Fe transport|nr:TonB-dependent receptor [Caulobacteraceae bacterium]
MVETVIVTGSRLHTAAGETVFSKAPLPPVLLLQQPRLDQALEQIPGLSLFRRSSSLSANPTVEGVSLRSIAPTGAGRALVTLDGVPQGDPFGGWVIWSDLPSEGLQSAEVVRGAGAGSYGAGALTGSIALTELELAPGQIRADAEAGEIGYVRAAGAAAAQMGAGILFVDAAGERSDGWIPVIGGRGAADTRLSLKDWEGTTRYEADLGGGVLAARVSAYAQDQGTGVVGGFARTSGVTESLSWARQPTTSTLGYDLQVWGRQTGFSQLSLSEAVGHATAKPADLQYATPAFGYGVNGAVRRATKIWSVEAGFDARTAEGQTHELYSYTTLFTDRRIAGGDDLVAGAYAEASLTAGPWLISGGARIDYWRDWNGELQQNVIATGQSLTDARYRARGGTLPTGRLGLKRDLGDGDYFRVAGYVGFRAPSLNELYRPFRVGNNSIAANAALEPERLYGIEGGGGRQWRTGSIDADIFYNRIADPIINVTLDPLDPTVLERENVPTIDALGVEAQARQDLIGDRLRIEAAISYTDARVAGGTIDPILTGKRPAQTPGLTVTGGVDWRPINPLEVFFSCRYESRRFDDDLNTNPLGAATTVNARATWHISRHAQVFIDAQNLLDTRAATAVNTDKIVLYGAPRIVSLGVSLQR